MIAEGTLSSPPAIGSGDGTTRQILDHPDFQTLCDAIVNDCSKFDNFSIVNCLYAVAALGKPGDLNSAFTGFSSVIYPFSTVEVRSSHSLLRDMDVLAILGFQ